MMMCGMFVLLAGLRNPYYTEMDGTDNAKKLKGQDSFEVTQPVAKDMLHFLGKRMSKGLRTTDQARPSENWSASKNKCMDRKL